MSKKKAIIIGAGPAGLTAAFELLQGTGVEPVVLEMSGHMGGLSRTVNHEGNRIDLGGHRFFSKSDRVVDWWLGMLPPAFATDRRHSITYRRQTRTVGTSRAPGLDPEEHDAVMLLCRRRSRIYFLRRFFDYPVSLSPKTLLNLGLRRTVRIAASYLKSVLLPIRDERSLEDFLVNRFGRALYEAFFMRYTEKVWGVPCREIPAEWGAQRIKGLSVRKALGHALRRLRRRPQEDVRQKGTETSLIENFLYPKFGPGQMWETVAGKVRAAGGRVLTHMLVDKLVVDGSRIAGVEAVHTGTGAREEFRTDYVLSTMPMQELVRALDCPVPASVREVSEGLVYRDFITVGLLLDELKVKPAGRGGGKLIRDNWIYIQEPDVRVGRMQIYNNWTPYLVKDPEKVWIGLEYFVNETDRLWRLPDGDVVEFAKGEMEKIGIIEAARVEDACVLRQPKTYPAYFGTYPRFDELRAYLDSFENLFLVGRNGMHKYNNQDHSMLTAMVAVENIAAGRTDKANIWAVNTEAEYHERSG